MKKFLKVLGIIVGAIVLIIILAFVFTSGLPKVADTMFTDIKAGNVQQAYEATAGQFKSSTTLDQFQAFVQQAGLNNFKDASRTEREIMNDQGILKGTVTLTDNSKVPFEVNLIKEDGEWKILNINIPEWGITNQEETTTTSDVPSQKETTVLVKNAMKLFADAINQKDFNTFYNNIAELRKWQTTVAELNTAFKPFIDNEIDLSVVNGVEPEYTATPMIDTNGVLSVDGQYTFQDGTVIFSQKYFKENNEWKLMGINIKIK